MSDGARAAGTVLPRETLQAIVDAMADPLFVKNDELRFIMVNRSFCDFLGHSTQALMGKTDYDFFPAQEADVFREKDLEVMRTGGVNVNRELVTDKQGRTSVIVTNKTVFTGPDGRKVLVGTIRDSTAQFRAEEALKLAHQELERRVEERTREVEEAQAALRQAQKMEALGQLTGGIAHDFNNLLTVIMGSMDLAATGALDQQGVQDVLGEGLTAAQRGAELVQRLLAFARRQRLREQITDVGRLLERMTPLLARSLSESIDVQTDLPPQPLAAQIDPGQLETAILNLAINARDAMPGGGRLSLSVSPLMVDEAAATEDVPVGEWVLIDVRDSGAGIPADILQRVFEPFFSTKGHHGSGLGLSMVYGFVKQSQGHISADSEVGQGSSFRIYLPRVQQESVDLPRSPLRSPTGGNEHVLVLEDDPAVRAYVVRVVRSLGYRVSQASTVEAAREALAEGPPVQLLLSDVVLREGPVGPSFAAEVIAANPSCAVLLMSGYTPESYDRDETFTLIQKPFQLGELAAAMRQVLEA